MKALFDRFDRLRLFALLLWALPFAALLPLRVALVTLLMLALPVAMAPPLLLLTLLARVPLLMVTVPPSL